MEEIGNTLKDRRPNYKLLPGQEELCYLNPIQFDVLCSVIDIYKMAKNINIHESIIGQNIFDGVYSQSNILDQLNGLKLSLNIINPQKAATLFKLYISKDQRDSILIIKDNIRKQYTITNLIFENYLPFIDEDAQLSSSIINDDYKLLGQPITINDPFGDALSKYNKSVDDDSKVYLLLDENKQLSAVSFHTGSTIRFPDFSDKQITYETASYRLNISRLLPIKGHGGYTLNIAESIGLNNQPLFWCITECNTPSGIFTRTTELVQISSITNDLM